MVKVIDGKHYMVSTPKEIIEVFVFKVIRFRKYQAKVNWLTRTLTFPISEVAARCFEEMRDAEGVSLSLHRRKINVRVPRPLKELVD